MAYATVREVVGRAANRCALTAMNDAQLAAFDPFASADQNIILLLEHLRGLGKDLATKITAGLSKKATIVTAGGATSYAVPSDFQEMVDQTGWTGLRELQGPVSARRASFLQAWTSAATIRIPFRLMARQIVFPVAPADGLTITYDYVSDQWVTSVGSQAADKTAPTLATDAVNFDDELVILGLVWLWRDSKGFDTTTALARYLDQLDAAKGQATAAPVLHLGGSPEGERFLDASNLPDGNWGVP